MKNETREPTPKDRIVVLEKGKDMEISPISVCCTIIVWPYRG